MFLRSSPISATIDILDKWRYCLLMDIIKTYRSSVGISQAKLARLLTEGGCPTTQALVSQIEKGRVRITPERAVAIERISKGELCKEVLIFGAPPTAHRQEVSDAA
ncbi:helix-turn-helix domain-containing protein [Xylella fastidiosa subsp. sandyi]|uniref:helix-turn-helix domain-containing protein n=1 Tax=Xylella fastidiosa TaxID=2371 RepID=UPI000FFF5264|nr:helix-turn-helix domain-containing protein [Xylella fastidiosa]WNY18568.1 helix-turn-helix domain-containing protein [Xylella fastidiosa]WNY20855.1 helix-turn-helix domain-containing protein [Xylella fastidiosa]